MDQTKVYIAQLKCPQGHCIIALAGQFTTAKEAELLRTKLMEQFEDWTRKGILNRKCGLCGSTDLHPDVQPTIYRTMSEAEGPLRTAEAEQSSFRNRNTN